LHHCSLAPGAMAAASSWIERQRRYWDGALDRLDDYLLETERKKGL